MHWTSLDDLEGGDQTILSIVLLLSLNRHNSPIR